MILTIYSKKKNVLEMISDEIGTAKNATRIGASGI